MEAPPGDNKYSTILAPLTLEIDAWGLNPALYDIHAHWLPSLEAQVCRTVERGVGGVGGPGPANIAFYEKIEHNFEID